MQKKELKLHECVGKVLTDVILNSKNEQAILIFGDSFACVEAAESVKEANLDIFSFGDELLLGGGVISQEELREKWRAREEKSLSRFENQECAA